MAKKRQISVNVPEDVFEWFIRTETWLGESKTRLGLAGLVLLQAADRRTVADARVLASLIDRDLILWGDVIAFAEKEPEERGKYLLKLRTALLELPESCEELWSSSLDKDPEAEEPQSVKAVRKAAAKRKPKTQRRQKGA